MELATSKLKKNCSFKFGGVLNMKLEMQTATFACKSINPFTKVSPSEKIEQLQAASQQHCSSVADGDWSNQLILTCRHKVRWAHGGRHHSSMLDFVGACTHREPSRLRNDVVVAVVCVLPEFRVILNSWCCMFYGVSDCADSSSHGIGRFCAASVFDK